jgi:hypothetical protein
MSRCKACNRQIETYDRTTPLNAQILESVYNIDAYASEDGEDNYTHHTPLYPTMHDLEGRPEEDLCTSCRTSLIDSVQRDSDYQFEGQYEEL